MLGMRRMFSGISLHLLLLLAVCCSTGVVVRAAVQQSTARSIQMVNRCGPFLGVVVPNAFEMEPLLQSPSFSPAKGLPPYLDVAGTQHYMHVDNGFIGTTLLNFFHSWMIPGFDELVFIWLRFERRPGNTSRSRMTKRTITIYVYVVESTIGNLSLYSK
jgi:hypothetical protein